MEEKNKTGTPLVKKLGIKEGFHVALVGEPQHFRSLLTGLPPGVHWHSNMQATGLDMIHLFVVSRQVFSEALPLASQAIRKSGSIWVSWPKGTSNVPTDLNDNMIRSIALEAGLVDVKVCAIDAVWSGLKLVYRLKDR